MMPKETWWEVMNLWGGGKNRPWWFPGNNRRVQGIVDPKSLPGLSLWLKAGVGVYQDAAGTTPAVADTDPIGLWQDQSGNNNHFSQASDTTRPLLKLGANGINNLPALQFDGIDDYLKAPAFSNAISGTFFAVYKLGVTPGSSQALLASADEASTTRVFLLGGYYTPTHPNIIIDQRNNDAEGAVYGDSVVSVATPYYVTMSSNGSTWSARLNGVPQTVTVISANNGDWFGDTSARDNTTIGGLFNTGLIAKYKGIIAELLLYDVPLSPTDILRIEQYLKFKYNFYPALPFGEPSQILPVNLVDTPAVLINWDDGLASSYNDGFGYMQVKKIKGTTYMTDPLPMNIALVTEMYNAGWDVGNHTQTHVNMTTLTEAQMETSLITNRNYLDGLGFTRASRHVAYPGGYRNADVMTAMANTGMLTGRTVDAGAETLSDMISDPYNLPCYACIPSVTLADAKAYIDSLITNKKVGILLFHSLVNSNPTLDTWLKSDFEQLMDYINQRQLVSLTISQLYGLASAPLDYANPWYIA